MVDIPAYRKLYQNRFLLLLWNILRSGLKDVNRISGGIVSIVFSVLFDIPFLRSSHPQITLVVETLNLK